MSVKIIVDSGSDILADEARKMDVKILPLKVSFQENEYLDGVNLSHYEFYEKLIESDSLPKTSQISPYEYEQAFDEALKDHDEVICITLASKLSGCYQSANIARDDRENIYLIDSCNVAMAERALVQLAVKYRDEGMDAEAIVKNVEEKKKRLRILALLDTLEYLKKGGRISSATAFAGELLSIKPVVTVDEEGNVVMVGKARGSKNGNNILINMVNKTGIDFSLPHSVGYSGLTDTVLNKYMTDSKAIYDKYTDHVPVHTVGCAIGTHVGPGVVAVSYFTKE